MKAISYEEIREGDKIVVFYHSGFSSGVALRKERLYDDDPEAPETMWKMDGMEYLGSSVISWGIGGDHFLMEEGEELPVSAKDEWAKEARRKEEEKNK